MASYPSVDIKKINVKSVTGASVDIGNNGAIAGNRHFVNNSYQLVVEHDLLSQADAATLSSFYSSNAGADDISIFYDGHTYTCIFYAEPLIRPFVNDRWQAQLTLLGTRV